MDPLPGQVKLKPSMGKQLSQLSERYRLFVIYFTGVHKLLKFSPMLFVILKMQGTVRTCTENVIKSSESQQQSLSKEDSLPGSDDFEAEDEARV